MISCPWCNHTDVNPYLKVKDEFLTQEEFEIFACPQCHLLFTSPRPHSDHIGSYYESKEYYSHQENTKGFIPKVYESVKKVNLKNKVRLALKDLPVGRLLDIGCGVGDFLYHAKEAGWHIQGVEPSDQAKRIAFSRLGLTPLSPSDLSSLSDASFDVITMWHVLEHIDDLHTEVFQLHRLLKPGGRLVLALPNYQSFDAHYYGAKWAAWDVPRHLNHFSLDALNQIVGTNGFVLDHVEKLKWDAYYISFLSEKYLHHSLPLLRGAWIGLRSNCKAWSSKQYSSLVYVFNKQ